MPLPIKMAFAATLLALVGVSAIPHGSGGLVGLLEEWGLVLVFTTALVALVWRAVARPGHRRAWALVAAGLAVYDAGLVIFNLWISGDAAATLMKLLEALEDEDDVQTVYSNEDIDAAELEKLAG